jgi:arsenate reductase
MNDNFLFSYQSQYRGNINMSRESVLFVCVHNAARSQMAEGYLRARYGDRYDVYSAGTRASTVSRHAISTMKEIGIDISSQVSKSLEVLQGRDIDLAVILCDTSAKVCPVFPWARETIHVPFSDPGEFTGDEEAVRAQFRCVRDEITGWIDRYIAQTFER